MKRLAQQSEANSSASYDSIYLQRKEKGVDASDMRRWRQLLDKYRGGRLLDVGCLDSLVPEIAHTWYPKAEIWAIDKAEKAVEEMQERFPYVIYRVQDAYKTQLPARYFDYIVAGEIIEHLEEPRKFIGEMVRILKRGGVLALSTPLEEEKEVGAVDLHRHLWSYSEQDMYDLLSPHGTVKTAILRSTWFPYRYQWPTLLAFLHKNV